MEEQLFWGEYGEYGPFSKQSDGWPNAGEVIRHYRAAKGMSLVELALCYQQETGESATKQWISRMERHNKVPYDIGRRQALVKILEIPPVLLGVAMLEQVFPRPADEPKMSLPSAPTVLKQRRSLDLVNCETQIRTFWLLNETSHAHDVLSEVLASIRQLEALEKQSAGDLQRRVRELLYSHYRLACRVYRDLMELPAAYRYANLGVRVTKSLGRQELIAAALYVRGYLCLVEGVLGQRAIFGIIEPDRKKLTQTLSDFEQALPLASQQLKGTLRLELSRTQALLKNSVTDITIALQVMDLAEKAVDQKGSSADPYARILLDGTLNGLNEEEYLLGKAITFNAANLFNKSIEVFDDLDRLNERTRRGKDHTRYHAWIDIVESQAYLGIKKYHIAIIKAKEALVVLRDIDSVDNIANIKAIYDDLLKSSYRTSKEVNELGKMLKNYYQLRQKRKQ
jgi:transcriptional regulator with XRE-family HTH domain